MLTAKRMNSTVRSALGILLIAALLITVNPITAYAADNNPEGNTIGSFPATGATDTMAVNWGTINTLYSTGTINDNRGSIASSNGNVLENHGLIDLLEAGHVGTNYGTISSIRNTGSLGVNDTSGNIVYVGMGNEIIRNDGTIRDNAGKISGNYGTVCNNSGSVIVYDGLIENNLKNGTVKFEAKAAGSETIPAKGTIEKNGGIVEVNSGTVTIKENTGSIKISNAAVTIEKNSGSVSLNENAALTCSENTSDGVITKISESADVTCTTNNGNIKDESAAMYEIVFTGDDGKAEVVDCDEEKDGTFYTKYDGIVFFTLPLEYGCVSATIENEMKALSMWKATAHPEEGDTEFTIVCHKCSDYGYPENVKEATCTRDGYTGDTYCSFCSRKIAAGTSVGAKGHSYGDWVTTKDPTETETGTKERVCSVCSGKETDVIPVLEHTHKGVLQKGTPATHTAAGMKDYYTCSCGRAFEDGVCSIEITDMDTWKAVGGNGYIAPIPAPASVYTVTSDKPEHGTVTFTSQYVSYGGTVTITAIPDEGYEIDKILVNGEEVTDLTVKNITKDTRIKVTFKLTEEAQKQAEEEKAAQEKAEKDAAVKALAESAGLKLNGAKTDDGRIRFEFGPESQEKLREIRDMGYQLDFYYYKTTKKDAGDSEYTYMSHKIKNPEDLLTPTKGEAGTVYYYKAKVKVRDMDGNEVAEIALLQVECGFAKWVGDIEQIAKETKLKFNGKKLDSGKTAFFFGEEGTAKLKAIEDMGYTLKFMYYKLDSETCPEGRNPECVVYMSTSTSKKSENGYRMIPTKGTEGMYYSYSCRIHILDKDGNRVATIGKDQVKFGWAKWTGETVE